MPLYQRDPDAYRDYLAEGNAHQPRKRVGADVLIRDSRGRILLVDPAYKPNWDLPGGMAEANEPPAEAARRELKEELDLEIQIGKLLCVDWVAPHGPWDDSLMLIFDGGVLDAHQIDAIHLVDGELNSFEFCEVPEVGKRLRSYVWRRTEGALEGIRLGGAIYLHDGKRL